MSRRKSRRQGQNRLQNDLQNPLQNQVNRGRASIPVKATVFSYKGSDLLLLASNNHRRADARPHLLREGQIIYIRRRL